MSERRCTICDRPFDPQKSIALPFCSPRCKQIDRRRWLDEKYGLPYDRPDDEEPILPLPDDNQ